jgi:predicted nucleic acid-binding protein
VGNVGYSILVNENLRIFYSKELLLEYISVISRQKFAKIIRPGQVNRFIGLVITRLQAVEIKTSVDKSKDEKDDFCYPYLLIVKPIIWLLATLIY